MYQTINGFLQTWEFEAGATQRILDALTDESLKQDVTPQDRTLGTIAWHIVTSIQVIMGGAGLQIEAPGGDAPEPSEAQKIAESYRRTNDALMQALKSQWTDDTLQVKSDMFGQQMPNNVILMLLINHQNHHRGQLTILMRQAGLAVPGVYGPSREEWAAMGMEPLK